MNGFSRRGTGWGGRGGGYLGVDTLSKNSSKVSGGGSGLRSGKSMFILGFTD